MNAGQRIAILVVAVVVLVGGFVFARGSDEEDPKPTEPTTTVVPETTAAGATAPRQTSPQAPPPPRIETVRMRGRGPVGQPRTIRFGSGDIVRLRFRSDVAEEVHIHGYDKYVKVPAGGAASARFKADAEGIFEIESHGSGKLLAKLEIRP